MSQIRAAAGRRGLTVEDRFAIEELYSQCYWANDIGDAEGWAGAFHEGAVLVHDDLVVDGGAAIMAYVLDRLAVRHREPYRNGHHLITNLSLEGDRDVVRSRCYFVQLAQHAETGTWEIRTAGHYEDELRRLNGRWGFSRRRAGHEIPTWHSLRGPDRT